MDFLSLVMQEQINHIAGKTDFFLTNPREYGAKGDGTSDDTQAFKDALAKIKADGGGILFIPAGTYLIKDTLLIPPNMTIAGSGQLHTILKKGASFIDKVMLRADIDAAVGGYNAYSNLIIKDLTMDLNRAEYPNETSGGIAFAHSQNVVIERITMKNLDDWHFIEINSSKNVKVRHCTFDGYGNASRGTEMVQVDKAYSSGYPFPAVYDNTACENVLFYQNHFVNGKVAIGNHIGVDAGHKNVQVYENVFENMTDYALNWQDFNHSIIKENIFKNCFGAFKYLNVQTVAFFSMNAFLDNDVDTTTGAALNIDGNNRTNDWHIKGNRIGKAGTYGVIFKRGTNNIISHNEVNNSVNSGFALDFITNTIFSNNRTITTGTAGGTTDKGVAVGYAGTVNTDNVGNVFDANRLDTCAFNYLSATTITNNYINTYTPGTGNSVDAYNNKTGGTWKATGL